VKRHRRERRGGLSISGLRGMLSRPDEPWPARPEPPPEPAGQGSGSGSGSGPAAAAGSGGGRRGPSRLDRGYRYWRARPVLGMFTLAAAVIVVAGAWFAYSVTHQGTQVTAYFSQTIGVYPGSDVRILGVQVGTVTAVRPVGSQVKVTMTVDHGVPVPAAAKAVVVSPSVVADRYVQLAPAYTGGPRMQNGAVIPLSRTATPVEVDQLYASLDKLSTAFGPHGANSHDALSDLIKTGAANLNGNGKAFNNMLTQFSGAMGTLGGSSGNLSATIDHLQLFTTMLKDNNGQVELAEQQLAQVSGYLSADRQDLGAALDDLSTALGQIRGFIQGNRALIKTNVTRLASITGLLVKERDSLAEALDDAPLAADNLLGAYDPQTRTIDGRADLNEFTQGPATSSVVTGPGTGTGAADAAEILFEVPTTRLSSLPPLPFPVVGPLYATPQGTGGH
jgi:phospholipid/cholesterol/gamma-HCH transport system substrate-binding protein